MVKKYPLSNKAVKAMIAATIAFTPLATTALVFDANQVEAAQVQDTAHFNSISTFEKYALEVRNDSNIDSEVADALDSLNWTAAVNPVFDAGASAGQKAAVAALLELQTSIYTGTYKKGDLRKFIDDHKQYLGNLPDKDYITYLGVVEKFAYDEISNIADDDVDYTHAIFNSIVNAVKEADHKGIRQHVSDVLVITDPKMKQVVSNIEGHFAANGVTRAELKTAMMFAGAAWLANYGKQPGGNNGGGGETTPPGPVIDESGSTVTVTLPSDFQEQIIASLTAQTPEVVITVPANPDGKPVAVDIPGSFAAAIKSAAPNADLVIQVGGTSYVLPLSQVSLATLTAVLGGDLSQISLRVTIDQLTDTENTALLAKMQASLTAPTAASSQTKAAAQGIAQVAPAAKMKVELVSGNKVTEIKTFGDIYVEREFVLNKTVNKNRATGVAVEAEGSFTSLPTTFKTENGKRIAVVRALANSDEVYTVIESNITFPDVDNKKNWAEDYIEALASKYIISGSTAGTYKPNDYMTRAQFALLLSRSLGLPEVAYDNRFKDVKGDEWFNVNGALMAAVKSGIVAGKADGTFAPNAHITRAEAAAMIGRALNLKSIKFDSSKLNTAKKLTDFKDAKSIGASTRADVLKVYQAGIMSGASNGTFQPNEFTKRDQMARILGEFLIKANLIENIK
ncbi:S-layer homology domain-containing protein [Bacillus sp. 37MA]|uniref:S-layer homology domain-containing protein n=1 Tax=Bacillus sp. 37MA TaxID=1132442 RepID=UPI00036F55E8|nr:S-layer homology domain-containing protein [Bacillus sp. 37MA]